MRSNSNIYLYKILSVITAMLILYTVLILPYHPSQLELSMLLVFPLEFPIIVLALLAVGRSQAGGIFRFVLVAALVFMVIVKCADYIMYSSLDRGFNLVADLPLILSLNDLIARTLELPLIWLPFIGSVLVVVCVSVALWWACGTLRLLRRPTMNKPLLSVLALLGVGVVVAETNATINHWDVPVDVRAAAPITRASTTKLAAAHIKTVRSTLTDLRKFRSDAKYDLFADQTGFFDLVDRDVLIVFVESYGRTSLDTAFYAGRHRATLAEAQSQLEALGLTMSSTLLTSPTKGGQSWLAHSTFANGLWVTNQRTYQMTLDSGRQSLFHLAAKSGFQTAAVMPQITMDWPESQSMGFDTVLAQSDLGFRGKPFNWVTMPDQFTLSSMDKLLRQNDNASPMFIQIALASSHAPWVPIPDVLAWESIGDGSVYNRFVEGSDSPSAVWRDNNRVRSQYRDAIDYTLRTVFAYAALHAKNPPLMIIVGDHQAASFVAMDNRAEVPMHIIGPEHLVDRLSDENYHVGLIPTDNTSIRRMDLMRSHLVRSLTSSSLAGIAQ